MSDYITYNDVRMRFVNIYEAYSHNDSHKPSFSVTFHRQDYDGEGIEWLTNENSGVKYRRFSSLRRPAISFDRYPVKKLEEYQMICRFRNMSLDNLFEMCTADVTVRIRDVVEGRYGPFTPMDLTRVHIKFDTIRSPENDYR